MRIAGGRREGGVEFRMMEVIVLKLRGTISGVVSRFERLRACRGSKKKRREGRVIDFEIRFGPIASDKSECRTVNICRIVPQRLCHISENLNGYWICILILFIETRALCVSLSHATYQQADFAVARC